MKNDLTAINEKTVYLVIDEETEYIILETTVEFEAKSKARSNRKYFITSYPPFTYASNKDDSFVNWGF